MSCSPEREYFAWQEFHPAIDGSNSYNTYDIAKYILRNSGDYHFSVCLIDPLANKKQPNTGTSATEDLNNYIAQIRRDEGLGTDMYFEGWDTKGTNGRNQVSMWFKNANRCGRPFNNLIKERGKFRRLPTMWISHDCPKLNYSVLNWCYGEYQTQNVKAVNDPKPMPQQKNSHDNMCLEALAKDIRIVRAADMIASPPRQIHRRNRSITGR